MKKILPLFLFSLLLMFLLNQYRKYHIHQKFVNQFITEIKQNRKLIQNNKFYFDMTLINKDTIINVNTNQELTMSEFLNENPNVFINYWFKGCAGCEYEMPDIQKFYKDYKSQIAFLILSGDSKKVVEKYINENNYDLPFYILKNSNRPIGITVFPTSQLILNHKTVFFYTNQGYFNSNEFIDFLNNTIKDEFE